MNSTPQQPPGTTPTWKRAVFLAGFLFALSPWCSPPLALAVGMVLAIAGVTAFEKEGKKLSRWLMQACIVALGLRIALPVLLAAARDGFVFAVGTILLTFVLGFVVAKLLKMQAEVTTLVCSGTAICGGSAIAAVGPAINASPASMAVATGSIFLLNAVALYVFPPIGHALGLSDAQFGTWAGVAIHDMASVVGAAAHYHAAAGDTSSTALDTANVVKLSRVLWIVPIALVAAWVHARRAAKPAEDATKPGGFPPVPWFILFFIAASVARTYIPELAGLEKPIKQYATHGFSGALYLIGAGLSPSALKKVGWRAFVLALVLWVALSALALLVVRAVLE